MKVSSSSNGTAHFTAPGLEGTALEPVVSAVALDLPAARPESYRLGDALQCLLVSWGLFGQKTLVLVATWLQADTRALTVPGRVITLALSVAVLLALLLRPRRLFLGWPVAAFLLFWSTYGARLIAEASGPAALAATGDNITIGYITIMSVGGCFLPALAVLLSTCWSWHERIYTCALLLPVLSGALMFGLYQERIVYFENRIAAGEDVGDVTAVHALALGYTGAVLIAFALHTLVARRTTRIRRGLVSIALATMGVTLVVGSASRGPMVALAAILIVLSLSLARRRRLQSLLTLLVATSALTAGTLAYAEITGSSVFERLLGIAGDISAQRDTASRLDLYAAALGHFLESPLFGAHATLQRGTTFPHNLIIESLMATGLLGTIPLLLLLGAGLAAGWRLLSTRPELGWLPLLYVLFLVGAMFSGTIYVNASLWLTLAATLSCAAWARGTTDSGA